MRNRATISERGTITIPEPIRELTHLHPGDMVEFHLQKGEILLKHLVVKQPHEDALAAEDWDQFDKLVQSQLRKGEYTRYETLDQAKQHSRKLLAKK